METKLTLRLEESLINEAKKIARLKGVSLSRMVADYFKAIKDGTKKVKIESPILSEITGILSPDLDNKKLIKGYKELLKEKYL